MTTRSGVVAVLLALALPATAPAQPPEDEAVEVAVEAYLYAYPLVLMDATRRVATNAEVPGPTGGAPVNQFGHKPAFPTPKFTAVVRPNADTLYSTLWYDVTDEPLVLRAPDSGGRYYLLQMLDMWTDVFHSPGKRTTGTGPQTFAIVGPRWAGQLPDGVEAVRSPTGQGWVIGRTQADGPADFPAIHKFQAGMSAVPLGAWGKPYAPPKGTVDATVPKLPPVEVVAGMDAATFFARFAEVMKRNPPHANDHPILARMKRLGIEPGKSFDPAAAPPAVRAALDKAVPVAKKQIAAAPARGADPWRALPPPVGTYGTVYLARARVAYLALGANVPEDAVYPTATADADGKPFDSAGRYVLRFRKADLPPVRAFWSLTLYDDRQLFADNPLDRYAIGDRDKLTFDPDGSLTLYVQRESRGKEKESNWLPAPKAGGFSLTLRLYWPKAAALDGAWKPPPVRRVE